MRSDRIPFHVVDVLGAAALSEQFERLKLHLVNGSIRGGCQNLVEGHLSARTCFRDRVARFAYPPFWDVHSLRRRWLSR
jgi:hypothetical protein